MSHILKINKIIIICTHIFGNILDFIIVRLFLTALLAIFFDVPYRVILLKRHKQASENTIDFIYVHIKF